MMRILVVCVTLIVLCYAGFASATLKSIRLNNQAKELLETAVTDVVNEETKKVEKEVDSTKVFMAYKILLEALKEDPFNPVIRGNLGLAFELNDEKEKARKEFKAANKYAEASNSDEIKFISRFNLARSYGVDNKDKALELYQKALEIKPESKEVKTNIELLLMEQQGQGKGQGGKGDNKNKDKKDQNNEGQGDQEKQDQSQGANDQQNQPQQPTQSKKEFKSKELTKNDVRRILEELKNQEQQIREKEFGGKSKERPLDKDW